MSTWEYTIWGIWPSTIVSSVISMGGANGLVQFDFCCCNKTLWRQATQKNKGFICLTESATLRKHNFGFQLFPRAQEWLLLKHGGGTHCGIEKWDAFMPHGEIYDNDSLLIRTQCGDITVSDSICIFSDAAISREMAPGFRNSDWIEKGSHRSVEIEMDIYYLHLDV